MRQFWSLLTVFSFLTILIFITLPIDVEIVAVKWVILILFIIGSVRLVYYDGKLTFLRTTIILILVGLTYYWRDSLNLSRNWVPKITVYENKQIKLRTIELQTRETGEWPEHRMIDRVSIIPSVYWKKEIDEAAISKTDTLTWRKVNRKLN